MSLIFSLRHDTFGLDGGVEWTPLADDDFLRDSRLAVLEKTFVSVIAGSVFFSNTLVSLAEKY